MKKKNKKGFTLIELLAVIVILAVILVISIPRILDVIETSKKDSFKNAAQLIADSAEKKKASDKLLDKDESITCKDVAKISDEDYASCKITFDENGIAKVSITGKGKFKGLKITNGTKENAEVKEITKPTYGMKATEYISNLYEYDGDGLKKDNTSDQNIRYYGSDPNNYVSFNNELWRIIGVFGNNVKLVRKDSLGELSWDSSESGISYGGGINQWGESKYEDGSLYEGADLQVYLNKMYYGGDTTITCYGGSKNSTVTCPTNMLDGTSKSLIDKHLWNTGAPGPSTAYNGTINSYDIVKFYKAERGTTNGKTCTGNYGCNDTVTRTTEWTGYVALPYITDWAYASENEICQTNMYVEECKNSNWMNHDWNVTKTSTWYLSPADHISYASVFMIRKSVDSMSSSDPYLIYPSIYLKSNVIIDGGTGSVNDPYTLDA